MTNTTWADYRWSVPADADGLFLFDIRDIHRGLLGSVRATHTIDALQRWVRENQQRLDLLALKYLAAIESEDFDTIEALWEQAVDDDDLGEMLHELNAELAEEKI